MKKWVGVMDGKQLDTGTIFVDVELRGEDSRGVATQSIRCENSEVVKRCWDTPTPFLAEIAMVETTNGKDKGDMKVVTRMVPLERVVEKQPAKAA
ncbi:hypothetical protein [Cupriavidus plantarum]